MVRFFITTLLCLLPFSYTWGCRVYDGKQLHESSSEFQKLNASEGLCQLWFQGKQYVDFILIQAKDVGKDGHSKNFDDDDYNFFSHQEMNFNSTNINPFIASNPVEKLMGLINEFQILIGGKFPQEIQTRSNYYQMAIGLFLNMEKAKTIAIGRESELRGLQNFLFDQVMDFYLLSPNDSTFAGAVLLYVRARHFGYPKNYLFVVASEIEQVANQLANQIKDQSNNKTSDLQTEIKGLKTVAANMFAFCEMAGIANRFNFHFRGKRIRDWCSRRAVNLARELGLTDIELVMRRRLAMYLQDDSFQEERINNSVEILNIEKGKTPKDEIWKRCWLSFWTYYYKIFKWLPLSAVIIFVLLFLIGVLANPSEGVTSTKRLSSGMINFTKKIFGIEERKLNLFDRLFILILPVLAWMLLSPARLNNLIDGL